MLTIFRRHLKSCPHRSRRYRRCKCPIQVEGTLAGEPIRKALDLTSWEAAEALIREWNVTGKIGGRLMKSADIAEAIRAYIDYVEGRKLSPRSIYRYRAFLERAMLPWCEKNDVAEVKDFTFAKASAFYASWKTWSSYTVAKNLELFRMFLRYCVKSKWIEENVAGDLDAPKIEMAPTLPFTEDEERRILEACNDYRINGRQGKNGPLRMRAFVLTLRYSGLRVGDLTTLETKRLDENKLLLRTAKTKQEVWVPIPQFVADALRQQGERNSNPVYFFWTGESSVKCATAMWQRSLATLFKKAKVVGGHAHRYRDTFACSLLLKGVAIEDVAILLGHSDPAITWKHYAAYVKARQIKLEEAVKKTWEAAKPKLRLVKS